MCLKNAFRKMCITICRRFFSNKGVVASYGKQIWAKYIAKWGVQIMGMIFQTRSSNYLMAFIMTGLRHLREIKITINRRNAGFFMSNFIYFYVVRSCILSLYVI